MAWVRCIRGRWTRQHVGDDKWVWLTCCVRGEDGANLTWDGKAWMHAHLLHFLLCFVQNKFDYEVEIRLLVFVNLHPLQWLEPPHFVLITPCRSLSESDAIIFGLAKANGLKGVMHWVVPHGKRH
jgi:hypothetical protein